jgi:DNA polymerase-1
MRVALLDSDIIAYQAAVSAQSEFEFGDKTIVSADLEACLETCDAMIASQKKAVGADSVIVCLTDAHNFRKDVEPTYKLNRKDVIKPQLLGAAKDYMEQHYPSYIRPGLEADDVLGILQTKPKLLGGGVTSTVICSADKDLRTIPGDYFNPQYAERGVITISKLDAILFHLWQTITGDVTDGYKGCPGIGKGGEWSEATGQFECGARTVPYASDVICAESALEGWSYVLQAYASKGLTEDDAIHQARLARILWAGNYDFKKKEVILWDPTNLLW